MFENNILKEQLNNEILYSIIIPIYNCEQYLEKCVSSILNQDFSNFEIILINDGSTDRTNQICEKFSSEDKRIKYILKKNTGSSDSRNVGLKEAKGKYVLFIDSDDYVEKNYLSAITEILNQYKDVQLINFGFYSEVNSINNKTLSSDIISVPLIYMKNKEEITNNLVYLWDKHMLYNIWNKVYVNEIIKNNELTFPNYDFGEDMNFNKRYIDKIDKFLNSNQYFYHYIKERKFSITSAYNKDLFQIRLKEYKEFNEYFKAKGLKEEEYIEFSSRRFIERVVGCVENICSSNIENKEKKKMLKNIIENTEVRETLKKAKPKSKKMKIMLFPIKIKSTILLYIMGNSVSLIRKKFPDFFNKLKNKR